MAAIPSCFRGSIGTREASGSRPWAAPTPSEKRLYTSNRSGFRVRDL